MTNTMSMEEALERLRDEVEYRGRRYRYLDNYDSCRYMSAPPLEEGGDSPEPQCLVGGALYRENGLDHALEYGRECEGAIQYSYAIIEEVAGVKFSKGAVLVFSAAQGAQDFGATHGEALAAAERVAEMLKMIGMGEDWDGE